MTLRARDLAAAAGILLVVSVCIRLGFWQLDRLGQRRAANAVAEARQALPPLEFESSIDPDSASFRRVRVDGRFDFARQVVEVGRSIRGVPAVFVVTPLRLSSGAAVLIERTWVPSPDARQVDLGSFDEPAEARVEGVVMPHRDGNQSSAEFPLYVRQADPAILGARYPYELLPVLIRRTALPGQAAASGLATLPPPEITDGPHLSYAVQWFLFAVVALVGGAAALWRQRVRPLRGATIDIRPPDPQSRS